MGWSSKEARNAYLAEWRKKNRDKTRAAQKRYYDKNKETCDAKVLEIYNKNKAYYIDKATAWQKSNPEKVAVIRRRHYQKNSAKEIARVRQRQGRIKHCEIFMNQAELVEIQGMYDFCRIFKSYEVDHKIPLNGELVSGLHVLNNLQILLISENRSKSNKYTIL
jgi:5-methylcytosine-specific restriction endonuclease McrA